MSEIKAIEKLRKLPFHGTNGFGTCVTASKETISSIADEIEAEIAERYMLAPVDADGVPIRVGDEIQQLNHAGVWTDAMPVVAVDENGCFALTHGLACETRTYVWGNNCRHVKPRTLEDVLEEFADAAADVDERDREEWVPLLAKYADEIRELMEC